MIIRQIAIEFSDRWGGGKWLSRWLKFHLRKTVGMMNGLVISFFYISISVYLYIAVRMSTTIKISRDTLKELEYLRKAMSEVSIEGVIKRLILDRRRRIIDEIFGIDEGRIRRFDEEDRLEDRD